jgi:tRNA nucleotidyltransferase/poly(A) polymerase
MKKCQLCPEPKPLSEFNKRSASPDGLAYICKECNKKASKNYQAKNIQEINLKRKVYREENKQQIAISYKAWQLANPEKANANARKWVEKNKEKSRKSKMRYFSANLERHCAQQNKRRATKLNATPKWLTDFDYDYMLSIYTQAKQLEILDGIERHVDHIVPLRGKNVSGLHVPWNLQILTATENISKNNKF